MYDRWKTGEGVDLGKLSLSGLLTAFVMHPAIHLYAGLFLISVTTTAIFSGNWHCVAGAVLTVILIYPFFEYLSHRFILHGRFLYRTRVGAILWKRLHYDHHRRPQRLDILFGSPATTIPALALVALPLGFPWGEPAASTACGAFLLTLYELCHCMQHLNYRPRSRFFRHVKQLHMMHHFHAENANFGITSGLVDRLAGTYYGSTLERPRSPHVFDLGYDKDEAERYPWVAQATDAEARRGRTVVPVSCQPERP